MGTRNTCIICGGQAGSREHVFPAAFGGRRKDKGIYCAKHNQDFGRHVSAVLEQLELVNARLGVRGDGRSDVRPATMRHPDGRVFLVGKNSIRLGMPEALDSSAATGATVERAFNDMSDARKWIAQQEKLGFRVEKLDGVQHVTEILTAPLKSTVALGEPRFKRAMLYFGLTFLAHHWPERAYSAGLAAVKRELEKPDSERLEVDVWWEPPSVMGQLSENPYRLGHCVTVAVASSGKATALVSLWGELHFGMDLGTVDDATEVRVVSFMNPLEDHPPKDRQVQIEQGKGLRLGSAESGKEYLEGVIAGRLPNPVHRLMGAASLAELQETARELRAKLEEAQGFPEPMRDGAYRSCVDSVRGRVFGLLQTGIAGLVQYEPEVLGIAPWLQSVCEEAQPGEMGLSHIADGLLSLGVEALAREMRFRMEEGVLDLERLESLLGGGEGAAVVMRAALAPLIGGAVEQQR